MVVDGSEVDEVWRISVCFVTAIVCVVELLFTSKPDAWIAAAVEEGHDGECDEDGTASDDGPGFL